jgi:hypothetical protein
LGVPPAKQSLIFKGHKLGKKKDKLSDYGIQNSSRILLISIIDIKDTAQHNKTASRERSFAKTLDHPLHAQIVGQGPPDGCLPGLKASCNVFLRMQFVCYDTRV